MLPFPEHGLMVHLNVRVLLKFAELLRIPRCPLHRGLGLRPTEPLHLLSRLRMLTRMMWSRCRWLVLMTLPWVNISGSSWA